MALEPITRQEKIIAGQDLTPITRMEMFLKNFGGGGGSVPKPLTYDYMPEGFDPNGIANQQFVTDETGAVKWEDRQLLIANVTFDENWDNTLPATVQVDKTPEEIYSAATSGKLVYFYMLGALTPLSLIRGQGEYYSFSPTLVGSGQLKLMEVEIIYSNGGWLVYVQPTDHLKVLDLNVSGLKLRGEDNIIYKITVNDGTISATPV